MGKASQVVVLGTLCITARVGKPKSERIQGRGAPALDGVTNQKSCFSQKEGRKEEAAIATHC